jgi:SAM-dependent methyltransferase
MGSGGQLGEFLERVPLLREARLIGVDIDAAALDRNDSLDVRVVADLERDDLAAIPDASVDLVLSHWLFEHLRRVDVALAAIARILRPGGSAFILVPNGRSFKSRMALAATVLPIRAPLLGTIKAITGKTKYFYPAYYKFCTPEQVANEAEQAGLDIAALYFEELHYGFYDRLPLVRGRARRLSARRLEGHAPTTCSEMLVHLRRPTERTGVAR